MPLPRLVFGSLLDRWNAFAPLRIDPEILVVEQACTIARYDLRTEMVPLGGGLQIGFVGRCTYGLPPGRGIRPRSGRRPTGCTEPAPWARDPAGGRIRVARVAPVGELCFLRRRRCQDHHGHGHGTDASRAVGPLPIVGGWTCTHLSDSHGFGSGRGRRLGRFESDGAKVAKASVPTVRVAPRFDRGEDGVDHVGP